MRPAVVAACLLLLAPITDSWWASGSAVILDPRMVCKRHRRTRGRLAQLCRNDTGLLREISRGVTLGATECAHQFRHRRWNCTTQRRSMRKILMRGLRWAGFRTTRLIKMAWGILNFLLYPKLQKYYKSASARDLPTARLISCGAINWGQAEEPREPHKDYHSITRYQPADLTRAQPAAANINPPNGFISTKNHGDIFGAPDT
ncbi:unnamed protein product [Plutella xylostella]|uniref:Protein Wnt n=1 Tax=Plutella xylostella TaxID=51655 RepID=A0A8S4EZV3_PLUXY|nr:unnamed protein product [Plutella xylostella]